MPVFVPTLGVCFASRLCARPIAATVDPTIVVPQMPQYLVLRNALSLKYLLPRMDCLPAQPLRDTSEALSGDNNEHLVHICQVTATDPVED